MTQQKEKASAPTEAQKNTMQENSISNAEFMPKLFPALQAGEYGWTTAFSPSPNSPQADWSGDAVTDFQSVKDYPHGNAYFSVAILKSEQGKPRKRRKENFSRLPVIVADDFEGDAPCTYRLQTSAGKCQVGWKLSEPITDVGIAERLHKALAVMKLMPADGSGNNVVRYVRLSAQINTKYQPHFTGKLTHWEAERTFTVDEVCEILGIDADSVINSPSKARESHHSQQIIAGDTKPSTESLIANLCNGVALHDSLNVLVARWVAGGFDERVIRDTVAGIMKANNDGTERYKARISEIERSLKGAIEKFAPVSETDSELNFDFYNYEVERPKPIEFCIDGFIADGITIIAGAPGVGKTTILVALAATVAHLTKGGIEHPALRRPAIYVTEDKRQVERELYAMKQRGLIGATAEEIFKWFKIISAVRKSPEQIGNMVANFIAEFALEHESGYFVRPLTVLDTVSANIDLSNENDNAEVGKAIAAIKQANDGAPLWLTAHTPKTQKHEIVESLSVRGAGAFEGDANAVSYIFQGKESNVRFMKLGKHRYEADYSEIEFKTESFKEDVPCPWGGFQSVWYRCGLPTKSSKERREQYAENAKLAHQDERMKLIQEQIISRLQSTTDGTMNKTALRKRLGVRADVAIQAIGELVDRGIVIETPKSRERIISLPLKLGTDGNE